MKQSLGAPGVYLGIAVNRRPLASIALGERRMGARDAFTAGDPVMIGSVSKPVAGFVILQSVAKGVLRWNTTVGETFSLKANGPSSPLLDATLEQLTTHTAGLTTKTLSQEYQEQAGDTTSSWCQAFCSDYLKTALGSAPGAKFNYANAGCVFAAEMVAHQTGEDFNRTESETLIKTLGLTSTQFGEVDFTNGPPCTTRGHIFNKNAKELVRLSDDWRAKSMRWKASPAGNISMSCEDVLRFAAMVSTDFKGVQGVLVPESGWRSVYEPISPVSSYSRSGWGTWTGGLWHEGNSGRGELMSVQVDRKSRIAAVLYVNMNYEDNSLNFGQYTADLLDIARTTL